MGKGGADAEITQFEAALAAEVSKDVFKFDSFLIYTLGFFFGFLLVSISSKSVLPRVDGV
jgi:hypothetical protein